MPAEAWSWAPAPLPHALPPRPAKREAADDDDGQSSSKRVKSGVVNGLNLQDRQLVEASQLRPSLGADLPKARRFNHTGPLATPMQKLRANLELWENEGTITPVAYALAEYSERR